MTKILADLPLSVLDLSPLLAGGTPADSFRNSLDLARHAEGLGYRRYWVAEHHNLPGIASSATAVLIGHIAGGTSRIRVGSGGIMLPNHAPLVVAEQFGTLETLYPGRIDLGLGRAPGTDQVTAYALRRTLTTSGDEFPELLEELRGFLRPAAAGQQVRAIPGEGLEIPIWLLGSAGFSARLAAELGLPFAFARQFSPDNTIPALEVYRRYFKPSATLDKPYAMVGVNVIAAPTEAEARRLFTSHQQSFLNMIRGRPAPLPPPVDDIEAMWDAREAAAVASRLRGSVVGGPETVRAGLEALLEETDADELMVNAAIHDHEARRRSYEIVAGLAGLASEKAG